jgi:hypothetical protein
VDNSAEQEPLVDDAVLGPQDSALPVPEFEVDETEEPEGSDVETLRFDIASYPADYTVKVLVQKWQDKQLVIPEFQRAYVWNQPKASKLTDC